MKHVDLDQLFDGAKEIITWPEAKERGLKRYFTGEPCKYGHTTERLLSNRNCLECVKFRKAKYCAENPEKIRARKAKYCAENPEKERARAAKRRAENPEKMRVYYANYYAKNPEKTKVRVLKRNARKKSVINTPCADLAIQKYRKNGGLCFYCSMEVAPADVHCDHVIPISKRGPHVGVNLVLACAPCNLSKGAHAPSTWRKLPEKHRRRALNREQKVREWLAEYTAKNQSTPVDNAL